ncbi:YIP1 family protein [Halodurantibacterium flavum]|uniref:YIP1 family protein n=1 Tax=Halodurantibacterium flavum TaxID=1382802 RepID=A0ABW4S3V5_9RHOB
MSLTAEILRSYRSPRLVLRNQLVTGANEARALAFLMIACGLFFVAQWPPLARAAHLDPGVPLDARLGGALMAMLFILPLVAYAVAGIAHLVARVAGGRGSFFTARLALFWSMLAISPLMLLQGLLAGFVGGPVAMMSGLLVLLAFLVIWAATMAEAESQGD